jgi:hypothetical protein
VERRPGWHRRHATQAARGAAADPITPLGALFTTGVVSLPVVVIRYVWWRIHTSRGTAPCAAGEMPRVGDTAVHAHRTIGAGAWTTVGWARVARGGDDAPVAVTAEVRIVRASRSRSESGSSSGSSRQRVGRPGRSVGLALGIGLIAGLLHVVPARPATAATPSASEHAARLTEIEQPLRLRTGAMRSIWVDPVAGRDSRTGATRATAVRTLAAAWRRIPQGRVLADHGYRILVTRGRIPVSGVPPYMESRYGTAAHPIIISAADGPGTVTLPSLNVFDTRWLALVGVRIVASGGDGFHCERCDHLLLRRVAVVGADPASYRVNDLVKINQSQSVFIERSDLGGASDNALDMVAVQYASVRQSHIHDSGDWCAYAKGGSAYVRVEANELSDCGTGGFTAGQGTGFQFMVEPWLHYEAYDVKVTNNVIHDIEGAGLGVNGGFAILLAYNTLWRVGSRSHLLEFVAGGRSCDGEAGDPGRARCDAHREAGGWGNTLVSDGTNHVRIPNRQVLVWRNVIVNRTDVPIGWQHLEVAGPWSGASQAGSGVAVPARFDVGLRFVGNVIWSGPEDTSLGLGESTGCGPGSSCSAERILAENAVNERRARLVAPGAGDFRLQDAASWTGDGAPIPPFDWAEAPAGIPAGRVTNEVPRDHDGRLRAADGPPGAFAG